MIVFRILSDHCSLLTDHSALLEVSFLLSIFHGGFGAFVVGACAAFGLAGGGDLGDDLVEIGGVGLDGTGARGVTDGAEADDAFFNRFVFLGLEEIGDGEELAVALENLPLVGEIDGGEGDVLALDIHPDVHLGEVGERKDAEVFAGILAAVEKVPKFGALIFRVPLAEVIAVGEEAFLGAGLFLFAAAAAEAGVILVLLDGIEQGDGLEFVTRGVGALFLDHAAGVDGLLDQAYDETGADHVHELVAICHRFGEIVTRIDVDQREGHAGGPEGLFRQPCHDDRVLATGEEQGGILELGGGFPEHENGFGFELIEMAEVVGRHGIKCRVESGQWVAAAN